MSVKRKIAYGLLLASVFLLLAASLLPGNAFARYRAGAAWNTVINAPQGELPILSENTRRLTFAISQSGEMATWRLEALQTDFTYAPWQHASLTVETENENVHISMGEPLPPAGTYRLVFTWIHEETGTEETETVTFFINYSGASNAQEVTE